METLENVQARHRKEQKDLQGRITNKKKNATKKTRKGVNDECAELERQLKAKQEEELAALSGEPSNSDELQDAQPDDESQNTITNGATTNIDHKSTETRIDGVIEKLQNSSISTQTALEPQQSGPGKKRNRQKERLARRAAEQEASAVAAKSEAAQMTDHRGIEKTYFLKEFKANNLVEKEIQPDGHCLFSAVADQLAQNDIPLLGGSSSTDGEAPYRIVRKRATGYMATHPDDFAPFLDESLEGYIRKIRDTAEWGGQLELTALANAYEVEIRVLQDGRTEVIEPMAVVGAKKGTLWLAYYRHGYGLGEHYNSLRKAA
ncbi:hypothetical protein BX600DRAFT_457804 [Xylariales sp. PMI_506]|nr:hypothetical protein BX600DRAFT_457804 [Xylariales sp. PMI_506]